MPSLTSILPFSNVPMRTSGPFRSIMIGNAIFRSSRTFFTLAMRTECSSYVPWLMLMRATFMPARAIALICSYEVLAGPSVQIIFVFLMQVLRMNACSRYIITAKCDKCKRTEPFAEINLKNKGRPKTDGSASILLFVLFRRDVRVLFELPYKMKHVLISRHLRHFRYGITVRA